MAANFVSQGYGLRLSVGRQRCCLCSDPMMSQSGLRKVNHPRKPAHFIVDDLRCQSLCRPFPSSTWSQRFPVILWRRSIGIRPLLFRCSDCSDHLFPYLYGFSLCRPKHRRYTSVDRGDEGTNQKGKRKNPVAVPQARPISRSWPPGQVLAMRWKKTPRRPRPYLQLRNLCIIRPFNTLYCSKVVQSVP